MTNLFGVSPEPYKIFLNKKNIYTLVNLSYSFPHKSKKLVE